MSTGRCSKAFTSEVVTPGLGKKRSRLHAGAKAFARSLILFNDNVWSAFACFRSLATLPGSMSPEISIALDHSWQLAAGTKKISSRDLMTTILCIQDLIEPDGNQKPPGLPWFDKVHKWVPKTMMQTPQVSY